MNQLLFCDSKLKHISKASGAFIKHFDHFPRRGILHRFSMPFYLLTFVHLPLSFFPICLLLLYFCLKTANFCLKNIGVDHKLGWSDTEFDIRPDTAYLTDTGQHIKSDKEGQMSGPYRQKKILLVPVVPTVTKTFIIISANKL